MATAVHAPLVDGAAATCQVDASADKAEADAKAMMPEAMGGGGGGKCRGSKGGDGGDITINAGTLTIDPNGNITTDANGEATVTLPDWFEAINSDLRYQLTVIGAFAQAIVAEEVKNNSFTIRTSAPRVKVSWQVTGVRSDAAMRKNPFKVVEDKTEREKDHYLTPEAFDQPEEKSVKWAQYPELMKLMKQKEEQIRLKQGKDR